VDRGIIERLVCPGPHATTPLVVRADHIREGRLERGIVGCPVCLQEWSVVGGVARFGDPVPAAEGVIGPFALTSGAAAALLGLTEPGIVLVDGAPASLADALATDYGATVVAFDPPAGEHPRRASVVVGATAAPFGSGLARSALLLRAGRTDAFTASVARTVGAGGRIVGVERVPLPRGVQALLRQDGVWVAERERVSSELLALRRREP
jgi:hypothetical protein